jgi:hypothetical protein
MTMSGSSEIRHVGVIIPEGQLTGNTGTPRSVRMMSRAETYAVAWVDDGGREHIELVHRIGGIWHTAPNGENYASTLRSLRPDAWLAKALEGKRADGMASLARETEKITIPKEATLEEDDV